MRIVVRCSRGVVLTGLLASFLWMPQHSALADQIADAKAAVARFAGPQTTWNGPTTGPKAEPGKKIVYLSGDENNDICRLYGVFQKEAGQKIGWDVTIIDGRARPPAGSRA